MNCPICNKPLTKIKGDYGHGFECRKGYFYLQKDYPICHYAYREFNNKNPKIEHRYLFFPFVIYSFPDINESHIHYLHKDDELNRHESNHIINTNCIIPDVTKLDELMEKLHTYLIFK